MKTPIQELIEEYQQMCEIRPKNGDNDMRIVIHLAKIMLKKEKEVMCRFVKDYDLELIDGTIRSVEDSFDETFNKKEK